MKKNKKNEMLLKHETFKGTFTDYRGMSRDFTMVAVSIPVKEDMGVFKIYPIVEPEDDCLQVYTYEANFAKGEPFAVNTQASTAEKEPEYEYTEIANVRKMLAIGVSVRCVRDKDLNNGESIAYGKALKDAFNGKGHVLFVSHGGMINSKMVRALLEQEAEHFSKDPGSYLKGYNGDRDRYLQTGYIGDIELTWDEFGERYPLEKAKRAEKLKPNTKITVTQEPVKTQPVYIPEKVLNEEVSATTEVKTEETPIEYGASTSSESEESDTKRLKTPFGQRYERLHKK